MDIKKMEYVKNMNFIYLKSGNIGKYYEWDMCSEFSKGLV
jgi:hypothetical protein